MYSESLYIKLLVIQQTNHLTTCYDHNFLECEIIQKPRIELMNNFGLRLQFSSIHLSIPISPLRGMPQGQSASPQDQQAWAQSWPVWPQSEPAWPQSQPAWPQDQPARSQDPGQALGPVSLVSTLASPSCVSLIYGPIFRPFYGPRQ